MPGHATAAINASNINGGNGTYDVVVQISATLDGTTNFNQQTTVRVPFTNNAKHADSFLRSALADYVLATYGLAIDPDDIYFPG